MKIKNKKYLLGLSLVASLIMGGLLKKPVFAFIYPQVHSIHSIVMARDIPTYTQHADTIFIGHVKEVGNPYFNQEMIQRDVEISVDKILKGDSEMANLVLAVRGGQIGNKRVITDDEARFKSGENVLLFLGVDAEGEYVVFAGPYGKYLIHEDGNVSSAGDFTMPLDELVSQIDDELENGEPLAPPQDKSGILEE